MHLSFTPQKMPNVPEAGQYTESLAYAYTIFMDKDV